MKKIFLGLAISFAFIACNNSANTEARAKDSLDSVAKEKKDKIDSSADRRKDVVDSTTEHQKDALDKMDSMNRKKDSAAKH